VQKHAERNREGVLVMACFISRASWLSHAANASPQMWWPEHVAGEGWGEQPHPIQLPLRP